MALRSVFAWVLPFLCAAAVGAGCGGDEAEQTPPPSPECAPNTSYTCVGFNACAGRQVCGSDSKLTACVCDSPPLGMDSGAARDAANVEVDSALADAATGDDAGMTAIDAATPACTETCVQQAPSGWSGPLAFYSGAAAAPGCGGDFPEVALTGGNDASGAAATCSSCSCTPMTGACSAVDFATGDACGATSCAQSVSASCTEISTACITGAGGVFETKLPAGVGTCTPSAQTPTIPPVTWATSALGCAPKELSRQDCAANEVCAPVSPGAPFGETLCVWKAGDVSCPKGDYNERTLIQTTLDDSRGCSECACAGPDCQFTWKVFDEADTSCATPQLTVTSAGQCRSVVPAAGKLRVGAELQGAGTCTPSGGGAAGSVSAGGQVTVCCM